MGAKLGIEQPTTNDSALIDDFLALLQEDEIDYTQAFWQLANELTESTDSSGSLVSEKSASAEPALVDPTAPAASLFAKPDGYLAWRQRWLQRIGEKPTCSQAHNRCNAQRESRSHSAQPPYCRSDYRS